MNKMTVALVIVLVLGSGAVGFIFGSQFNSESLVLNITNESNDTGFDTGFYDDSYKKSNTTKKKNSTSNSTKKNITSNSTDNDTDKLSS